MIRLYHSGEKDFINNGLGSLNDAAECVVKHEVNGEYELEMQYPIDGKHYDDIVHRRIIYTEPDKHSKPQPFRIYRISRPINGFITINAHHVSYDMADYPVGYFKSESLSDTFIKIDQNYLLAYRAVDKNPGAPSDWGHGYFVKQTLAAKGGFKYLSVASDAEWNPTRTFYKKFKTIPFVFDIQIPDYILVKADPGDMQSNFKEYYTRTWDAEEQKWVYTKLTSAPSYEDFPTNMYYERPHVELEKPSSLKSILSNEKGMLLEKFDGEWDYDKWTCTFKEQIGQDRGVYISYGKNMLDLKLDEDSSNTADFIYPYYYSSSDGFVELDEKMKILAIPEAMHSDGDDFITVLPVDLTKMFTKKPTANNLLNMAYAWIAQNTPGSPEISNSVSIIPLTDTTEYVMHGELEDIRLGDTIHLRHSLYKIDRTVRCMSIEYDAVTQTYRSINLETNKKELAETIAMNSGDVKMLNTQNNPLDLLSNGGLFGSHIQFTKGEDGTYDGIMITQKNNDDEDVDSGWAIKIGTGGISYRSTVVTTNPDQYIPGKDVVTNVVPTERQLLSIETGDVE